jgi:hypothetical protein
MRKNAVEAVIVRPDRYVFGGARDVGQLNMLIKTLIEELGGRSQASHGRFPPVAIYYLQTISAPRANCAKH